MRFFRVEILLILALTFSWVDSQDVQCAHVTLSENSGIFTSPNYPNEYDHKLSCSWTITASPNNFIHLTFVEFDMKSPFLKCAHDFVTVDNGTGILQTYCNNHRPPHDVIKSEGNVMILTLRTDDFFRNGKGFKASYKIVDKDGKPLDKEEDEEVEDETTDVMTTSTTTSTKMTTKAPKQSTKASPQTTSVLLTKLSKATTQPQDSNDEGELSDPGKTSGFVIGSIVAVIVAVVMIICAIAFARYRKNKNKRISLSVIVTPDDKELINNGKIYKKIGNKIVKDPEAETFPL